MLRKYGLWVAIIVIVAAVPRLLSFEFSLPYVDHPDEPNKYLAALEWRGEYDNFGYYNGNPPAYIAVHYLIQEIPAFKPLARSVWLLRLVSVIADLFTVVLIAAIARTALNPLAGVLAAAVWALSPLVIENNVYALPDPLIALAAALAVWLAIMAVRGKPMLAVISVIVGGVATLLKYPALPLVAPGFVSALLLWRERRGLAVKLLATQALFVVGLLVWIFFVYGIDVQQLNINERAVIRDSGFENVIQPARILNNIYYALYPLTSVGLGVLVIGAVAFFFAYRQHKPYADWRVLVLCGSLLFMPWLVAAYTQVDPGFRMRDVLPATVGMVALLGIAAAQIAVWLPTRYATPIVTVLFGLLIIAPQLPRTVELVQQRRLPDNRVAMRSWADANLEAGTVLVDDSNHKTFNPYWSGLRGQQWFDWWETHDLTEYEIETWREERGMSYAVLPVEDWQAFEDSDAGQVALSQMLFLRAFDDPDDRAQTVRFYRLWRMQQETDVTFGNRIRLLGYDAPEEIEPGYTVPLRFYWQADSPPRTNYSLYIHLTAADSREVIAQLDGAPARPTSTWTHPDETLISPEFTLPIPDDLPPGEYRILIGLYNFETFERLPVAAGELEDAYTLLRFAVSE